MRAKLAALQLMAKAAPVEWAPAIGAVLALIAEIISEIETLKRGK